MVINKKQELISITKQLKAKGLLPMSAASKLMINKMNARNSGMFSKNKLTANLFFKDSQF